MQKKLIKTLSLTNSNLERSKSIATCAIESVDLTHNEVAHLMCMIRKSCLSNIGRPYTEPCYQKYFFC